PGPKSRRPVVEVFTSRHPTSYGFRLDRRTRRESGTSASGCRRLFIEPLGTSLRGMIACAASILHPSSTTKGWCDMDNTVVALFERPQEADAVRQDLIHAGLSDKNVTVICELPLRKSQKAW